MTNINTWAILTIVAVILLLIFWRKRSAIWGGLTIGAVIGFLIAIIYLFKGSGFDWSIIGKGAVLGTMVGFIAELLGMLSDSARKKRQ